MKQRYLFSFAAVLTLAASSKGQSTPGVGVHALPSTIVARDVECDTVDFEGLASGTTVIDQYLSCGAIFQNSVSIDYGVSTYGNTIHSPNWSDPLEVHFVDPDDGVTPRPVQYVSFKNVVDPNISSGEIDYVTVYCYDVNNNVVAWAWGTGPARVEVSLSVPLITRIVVDDTMNTAYTLDDFVFDGIVNTGVAASDDVAFRAFPNPVIDVLHVQHPPAGSVLLITDLNGREMLRPVAVQERTGFDLDLQELAAGPYLLRVIGGGVTHTQGLIKL